MIAFHAGGYGFVPYGLRLVARRLQEPQADRAVLHQERARRVRRRPAPALGLRVGQGDRQPDGLRLRGAAPVLVLPPRLRLGRRRRVHRAAWSDSIRKFNYHGRHAVPVRRRSPTSARRTAATSSTSKLHDDQPARHRDRLRHGDGRRCRRAATGLPPLPPTSRRPRAPGRDDVRPPQRAQGAEARLTLTGVTMTR